MEEGNVWFQDADNLVGPFAALYGQFGADGPLALKVVKDGSNYPGEDLRTEGRVTMIHFLQAPIGDPHNWSSWQYELGYVFDTFNDLS
jgi:hypothetical protein